MLAAMPRYKRVRNVVMSVLFLLYTNNQLTVTYHIDQHLSFINSCCANQVCQDAPTCDSYPNNIGSNHYFCGVDKCDAAYNCHQHCPSGFDAECNDPTHKCYLNTPCNANIEVRSADVGQYGLPLKAQMLMRQYRIEKESTNAVSPTSKVLPAVAASGYCIMLICWLFMF